VGAGSEAKPFSELKGIMLRNVINDPGPIVWKKLLYEKRDRDLGLGI